MSTLGHAQKLFKTLSLLTGLAGATSLQAADIDVLVVTTPGATEMYGADLSTRINQLFQVSNTIYADSGVDAKIRLVGIESVNYPDNNSAEDALNDITSNREYPVGSGQYPFQAIEAQRQAVGADMVVFYRPYHDVHGSCGLAWVLNFQYPAETTRRYTYSHVALNFCGDYVTAHELGHNMGLNHSRRQDGQGAVFPYAVGYGVDGVFTDVMAYTSAFNLDYWTGKVYKFSNPDIVCRNDLRCGVDANDPVNGADARLALNHTAPQVANFYAPPAPPPVVLEPLVVGYLKQSPVGENGCTWSVSRRTSFFQMFRTARLSCPDQGVVAASLLTPSQCLLQGVKDGYFPEGSGCNTVIKQRR